MNELKMNGFNELAMDEMMAVDGGGAGHDIGMAVGSAAALGLSAASKGTIAYAFGVGLSAVTVIGGIIYINYKYAPRTVPKNRHHR